MNLQAITPLIEHSVEIGHQGGPLWRRVDDFEIEQNSRAEVPAAI
jgi:hypothetical protein